MKKKFKGIIISLLAILTFSLVFPTFNHATEIEGNFSDIVTKGPWVDVRAFMDGKSGRPTYATWYANQSTTDVTAAVQAAINVGGDIYSPAGIYLLNSVPVGNPTNINLWIKSSSIKLRGNPGKTIFRSSYSSSAGAILAIWKNASIYTYETATSYIFNSVNRGSKSVTMTTVGDAAHFTVGDTVYIKGVALPQPGEYYGDTNIVTSANAGTGVVGLAYPLSWNYTGATRTMAVVTTDTLTDISIEGITFEHLAQGIQAAQVEGLSIKNCKFTAIGTFNAFQLNQVHDLTFENNKIYNPTVYSAFDPARNTSRAIISKNRIYSQSGGIGFGEGVSHIEIIDNQIFVDDQIGTGSAIGVASAYDVLISRNQIDFNTITVTNSAILDNNGAISEQVIISDNEIFINSTGIGIKTECDGTIVRGNFIQTTSPNSAIYQAGAFNLISNNTIILNYDSVGIMVTGDGKHNSIIIGNIIRNTVTSTSFGIRISDDGVQTVSAIITGNRISGFKYGISVATIAREVGIIIEHNAIDTFTTAYSGCLLKNGGKSAAISTGQTIAHGLAGTPTKMSVVAAESGPTDIYLTTVDGTNLTVNFGGGGSYTFYWQVEYIP